MSELIYAIQEGNANVSLELIKKFNMAFELIKTGNCNPDYIGENGNTCLIYACDKKLSDVALALIQSGQSKPEQVNNEGNTALIIACKNKLSDVALALIETGQSNPEQANNEGFNALMFACISKMRDVAHSLIKTKKSNPDQVANDGFTALMLAIERGLDDVAEALLDTGLSKPEQTLNDFGKTDALSFAAWHLDWRSRYMYADDTDMRRIYNRLSRLNHIRDYAERNRIFNPNWFRSFYMDVTPRSTQYFVDSNGNINYNLAEQPYHDNIIAQRKCNQQQKKSNEQYISAWFYFVDSNGNINFNLAEQPYHDNIIAQRKSNQEEKKSNEQSTYQYISGWF
jgi:ankyrin repeat protein